jgi:hypothetical protein
MVCQLEAVRDNCSSSGALSTMQGKPLSNSKADNLQGDWFGFHSDSAVSESQSYALGIHLFVRHLKRFGRHTSTSSVWPSSQIAALPSATGGPDAFPVAISTTMMPLCALSL